MRNQPAAGGGEEEGQQLASAFFFLARVSNLLKTIQSGFKVFSFAFLLTKFLQFCLKNSPDFSIGFQHVMKNVKEFLNFFTFISHNL
jgi:hypothetical protein